MTPPPIITKKKTPTRRVARDHRGLLPIHYELLRIAGQAAAHVQIKTIAWDLDYSISNICLRLQELNRAGLLEFAYKKDRRTIDRLTLTIEGRHILDSAGDKLIELDLTKEERRDFAQILDQLYLKACDDAERANPIVKSSCRWTKRRDMLRRILKTVEAT